MCCFTQPVKSVSSTRIFARPAPGGRQYLAYQMQLETEMDVAMVLPLPVPPNSPADTLKFINLQGYPTFFDDFDAGFAMAAVPAPAIVGSGQLQVVQVGNFEASYVPSIPDFKRLDQRFQISANVWNRIPVYEDFGFAVFKLKPKPGKQTIHPMAFVFPRRNREEIFFPTVHVHDGEFHKTAEFDHVLYLQVAEGKSAPMENWIESKQPAGMFMKVGRSAGLIDPKSHVHMSVIVGDLPNRDTVIT